MPKVRTETIKKNGYILEPVLIFFLLGMMVCAWISMMAMEKRELNKAVVRSDFDLKVIEQAKERALELSWLKRCHLENSEGWMESIEVDGISVDLINRKTCLESRYRQKGKTYSILLFYDEQGIVKVEYE